MVDNYRRSTLRKTKGKPQGDLSKYETLDEVKDELTNHLSLANVDQNVVVFQDKQGRLKTSKNQLTDNTMSVPYTIEDNLVVFIKHDKIKNSEKSVLTLMGEITERIRRIGDIMYIMSKNTILL